MIIIRYFPVWYDLVFERYNMWPDHVQVPNYHIIYRSGLRRYPALYRVLPTKVGDGPLRVNFCIVDGRGHHMAEEVVDQIVTAEFEQVWNLVQSSESVQIALTVMVVGIIGVMIGYRKFSSWMLSRKTYHRRPHISRLIRRAALPFFATALITGVNMYTHSALGGGAGDIQAAQDVLNKILDTFNVLVIGYTVAHIVPIIINKVEKSGLEKSDFDAWFEMRGFVDDDDDLFHRLYQWAPPKTAPEDLGEEEFVELLKTKEGMERLERFRTTKGTTIGSYRKLKDDPYEEWKESERKKYQRYYDSCISGDNESGIKLKPGARPLEIFPIDVWRAEKRDSGYKPLKPGARPPGYGEKKQKNAPLSLQSVMPLAILAATLLGVASWWGVDLFVLATATGGFSIGLGLALQDTMQNYFAYMMIRKDKIVKEGDLVELESGYSGFIHKITPRVTYVMHRRYESIAIVPTVQLVSNQVINFTKETKLVRFVVTVGTSYLDDPREVISILRKAGYRALKDVKDPDGSHLLRQKRCPYLDENKPSCGCDADLHVDINQPAVRLNNFGASSIDYALHVFSRDYDSQFRAATAVRVLVHEELRKHGITIPWPIVTLYRGDQEKEMENIDQFNEARRTAMDKYGIGSIPKRE